jgi:hypothetical protein
LVSAQNETTGLHSGDNPSIQRFVGVLVDNLLFVQCPPENDYWVTDQLDGFSGDGLHVLSPKSGRDERLINEFLVQGDYFIS